MSRDSEQNFLAQVLQGDQHAVSYCETLFRISQTLDDLVDGDNPVTSDTVFNAFYDALVELPGNPFYRANEPTLRPMMRLALQDYRDSVLLEQQGGHGQTLAFVLRDQLTSIVVQCAGMVGGNDWMRQVSTSIRAFFHEESLQDYLVGLNGPADDPEPEDFDEYQSQGRVYRPEGGA